MSNIAGYGQRFIEKVPQATLILFFCFCSIYHLFSFERDKKKPILHANIHSKHIDAVPFPL